MKFCYKCGAELFDEAVLCPKCGVMQNATAEESNTQPKLPHKGVQTANKVLLVIMCCSLALVLVAAIFCTVCSAVWADDIYQMAQKPEYEYGAILSFTLWVYMNFGIVSLWAGALPLAWSLPMTVHYFKKCKKGEPTNLAFKICTLIFTHTLVGILMLCFEPNKE